MGTYLKRLALFLALLTITTLHAQEPFLTQAQWAALRSEASGAAAYENLRALTRLHRVPSMPEFDQAAEYVLQRAKEYGLSDAHSEQFPIDGKLHYGLMRTHLAWHVEAASLWETRPDHTLLGDWATNPIHLADYSHSADTEAALVDVGSGTSEADYAGRDVRGKILLADGLLSTVQRLGVMEHGAAGIISDMPNQATAWSGLDPTLIRWGHLDPALRTGFAFMVSHATAADLRVKLSGSEPVRLSAHVSAEMGPGHWTIVTATIPGTDPNAGEVVYSCHLDHQRPGANDNASGCVAILESARVLNKLLASGALPRPSRTLRFLWGPEVEGTMAFLSRHPETRRRLVADIHMDMVGGDLFKNKSVLHVTATPWSLPSFVTDVGDLFAETIRDAATAYAEDNHDADAAVLENRDGATGTRDEFFVDETPYAEGSDHDDYDSSTIAVPSLYLRDWPDMYIHTDHDTLEQIDATKLRRVVLLGAAAGYTYAALGPAQTADTLPFLKIRAEMRLASSGEAAEKMARTGTLPPEEAWYEARNIIQQVATRERAVLASFAAYVPVQPEQVRSLEQELSAQAEQLLHMVDTAAMARGAGGTAPLPPWRGAPGAMRIPRRTGDFGPLTYQNDDVLLDRLGQERVRRIQLLSNDPSRLAHTQNRGALYAYEILNLVDGRRTVGAIRDVVAAEFGPIPLSMVLDYLQACEEAGIVSSR